MADDGITPPHYEFSDKYDPNHARKYFHKHNTGFWRRLSTWREVGMARKALELAGQPRSVLDLPCGTGRFWAMLAEQPDRRIYVADNSQSMIDAGLELRPRAVTARIEKSFCCSAFDTGLPDNFVECVFSIRLLHHIEKSADRVLMLQEFARISSGTVIVSLWVDGNFRAWRHEINEARKARTRGKERPRDRFVFKRSEIERDFAAAGLEMIGHADFIRYWDKWRAYVLRVKK
ncbi:MAG: class I SAM-dependent methyltransferase [Rhodocyclaceae bacterium]|nr:class I SAM-dependent methyltransferase [Rhodocyclaceae bacterium]MCB1892187.1 class I SAM-dependent methyltransferase [Rhodocyclaceae bacterium]MCP5297816.1 class I SAM-dependent methyltransferase [Zoogloeaceae bacterium]MCW5595203.1 class I SAM-dependent methyltransferase [Rhodocyclaceae bacterium]